MMDTKINKELIKRLYNRIKIMIKRNVNNYKRKLVIKRL